jgi:hypothetical protein
VDRRRPSAAGGAVFVLRDREGAAVLQGPREDAQFLEAEVHLLEEDLALLGVAQVEEALQDLQEEPEEALRERRAQDLREPFGFALRSILPRRRSASATISCSTSVSSTPAFTPGCAVPVKRDWRLGRGVSRPGVANGPRDVQAPCSGSQGASRGRRGLRGCGGGAGRLDDQRSGRRGGQGGLTQAVAPTTPPQPRLRVPGSSDRGP